MVQYFPIWYFLSVILCKSMCISSFGPFSSPSNSFDTLLIHSDFLLCSLSYHILLQNFLVLLFWEFFTPDLVEGLSLGSEWHQFFSGLLDSSHFSGQSKQYCSLDGLVNSPDFKLFHSIFQPFKDHSKYAIYNKYQWHPHVPQLSYFSSKN